MDFITSKVFVYACTGTNTAEYRPYRMHATDTHYRLVGCYCHARNVRHYYRYIIFDEVHCLNEAGSGATWERLLLSTRCSFLALSATIGNPEEFSGWLRHVKAVQRGQDAARGRLQPDAAYHVQLIVHGERYNDLQHHIVCTGGGDQQQQVPTPPQSHPPLPAAVVYSSSAGPAATRQQPVAAGTAAAAAASPLRILEVHPFTSLSLLQVAAEGALPTDLSLTPHEVLSLLDEMWAEVLRAQQADDEEKGEAVATAVAALQREPPDLNQQQEQLQSQSETSLRPLTVATAKAALAPLLPEAFFSPAATGSSSLVTRPQAKQWEALIMISLWMQRMVSIQRRLVQGIDDAVAQMQSAWQQAQPTLSPTGRDYQLAHLMPLLSELQQRSLLPCIMFNQDRGACERFAAEMVTGLRELQAARRLQFADELDAARKQLRRQRAAAQRLREEAAKAADAATRRGDGGSVPPLPDIDVSAPVKTIGGLLFSLEVDEPDPCCTFLAPSKAYNPELLEAIDELKEGGAAPPELLEALRLGVGVHHSGLSRPYRLTVERLFRSKVLQVRDWLV